MKISDKAAQALYGATVTKGKNKGLLLKNAPRDRLARELKQQGVKEYIKLHELPACVTVDDSGFLAKVTINL